MAKRIVAKTGTYQKDGQDKGEYAKLGVMLTNDNGDYMLLDPCVNLAGVLIKQNALAAKTGGQQRDMVMVSIFDDDNQQQNNNQGQQQQHPNQAPQQQGGFQTNTPTAHQPAQQPARDANGFTKQQGGFANNQQQPAQQQAPHLNEDSSIPF